MLFAIESIILCALFTLAVVPSTLKDPLKQVFNYPPAIQERVKSLPEYKDKLPTGKRKLSIKIMALVIFIAILTAITYFSGAQTFSHAFLYTFSLWMVPNLFDVLVLDILLFCHDKRYRIPGTEDMVKEYTSPWFHIIGGIKGMFIGFIIALISASLIWLIGSIF